MLLNDSPLVMEITRNGFSPSGVWWGTGLKWGGSGVASADLGIGHAGPGVLEINGGTAGSGGGLKIPALKAASGTRYLCIDTAGNVTSSAMACSGN